MSKPSYAQLKYQIEALKLEQTALGKSVHAVFGKQGFAESTRAIFDQCKQVIGAAAGYVVLLSDSGEENKVLFLDNGSAPCLVDPAAPMPNQGPRPEFCHQAKVVFENHFNTGKWEEYLPKGYGELTNVLFVPLIIDDKVVGILGLANKPEAFTKHDAELAALFGDLAAMALANARYEEQHTDYEQSLLETQAELTAIYENAPVIMILMDRERRVRKANRLALDFSNRVSEEIIGLRGGEALRCLNALKDENGCGFGPGCGQCKIRQTVMNSLETGKSHFQVEASLPFQVNGKDQELTFLLSTTPLKINDQPMVLASIMDITQHKHTQSILRKNEERLGQAQKMEAIGTLASGIAHDFNNILFPLVGFAEMLKADLDAQNPLQDHVDEILHAALRSRELVQQILSFSYKTEPKARIVRLQNIVREAVKLIRAAIPATIKIQQWISPDCAPVNADPTQIHQIVMNLAINAFHAMEENGGTLQVTVKEIEIRPEVGAQPPIKPGRYAQLIMADNGIGIANEILDKIFDPYFTTKEEGKGTGLGLSVVQGLVHNHGGQITIESNPGQGTICAVFLPVIETASAQQKIEEGTFYPNGTESIMIVDDEEAIIRMLGGMLRRLGYQITPFTSSVDALERFKSVSDNFDLVITDMTMPDMTGIKLAREIKRIRSRQPVIICTGHSERLDAASAKALGMEGYLLKPVTIQEMAQTVRDVLDQAAQLKHGN